MSTRAVDPQVQCGLFRLPAEVRNDIYVLVLTVTTEARSTPPKNKKRQTTVKAKAGSAHVRLTREPENPQRPTVLSLLQSCRRINEEACGIFYEAQELKLHDCAEDCLKDLVETLGEGRRKAFRSLKMDFWAEETLVEAFGYLRLLPNLERARLRLLGNSFATHWHLIYNMGRIAPQIEAACATLPPSLDQLCFAIETQWQDSLWLSVRDGKAMVSQLTSEKAWTLKEGVTCIVGAGELVSVQQGSQFFHF